MTIGRIFVSASVSLLRWPCVISSRFWQSCRERRFSKASRIRIHVFTFLCRRSSRYSAPASQPVSLQYCVRWHFECGGVEPSHLSDARNPESRLLEHEQLPVGGEISLLRF
jgi:hypothetical protein